MNPIRVAFVDYVVDPRYPGRSGLSDIVWDMAAELARGGHTAYVVATYATDRYPEDGVVVVDLGLPPWVYRNLLGQLYIIWRARGAIRRIAPQVVHVPEYVSAALLSLCLGRLPVVLTVPGNIYHKLSVRRGHSYEWWYVYVLKLAARISARRAARVVAISAEMRTWWMRTGAPPERTACIPLGGDPRRFHHRAEARGALGLPIGPALLVYVGRFAREKGVDDLVAAVAIAHAALSRGRAQVVLIGRGPLEASIRARIAAHGLSAVVRIVPWVTQDQLATWYSAADAVVLPSHTEGMSRVIPEAFLCGTPIVGSAITGTVDHVRPGETGLLFPAGDVNALAEILAAAAGDPRALRGMRAGVAAYAARHLTWASIVGRVLEEVYAPLLGVTESRVSTPSGQLSGSGPVGPLRLPGRPGRWGRKRGRVRRGSRGQHHHPDL